MAAAVACVFVCYYILLMMLLASKLCNSADANCVFAVENHCLCIYAYMALITALCNPTQSNNVPSCTAVLLA